MKQLFSISLSSKVLFIFVFFVAFLGVVLISPNKAYAALPTGYIDEVTSSGVIRGWALDPDANSAANLEVHAYFDGPVGKSAKLVVGSNTTYARCDVHFRKDLTDCNFTYGYDIQIPDSFKDGQTHTVYVYALDLSSAFVETGGFKLLNGSPKTFRLNDVVVFQQHAEGAVVNDKGTIYYIGRQIRNPFPSAEVFYSWGYNFSQVVTANFADLALPTGPAIEKKIGASTPTNSNRNPIGQIDQVSNGILKGWTLDPDSPAVALSYEVYFDGQLGSSSFTTGVASSLRSDVNAALAVPGNHGIELDLSKLAYLNDGKQHVAYVYSIDSNDSSKVLMAGSPINFIVPSQEAKTVNDAKRLDDMTDVYVALQLYFDDNGKYPNPSSSNPGMPDMNDSIHPLSSYIPAFPTAPIPAEGSCTTITNRYWYSSGSKDQYLVSFCLGAPAVGLSAGVHYITEKGMY